MTIGLLGKKLGMTRISDEAGAIIPVTVIQAGPCPILQIKTVSSDGYDALQLGFDPKPERKVNRPLAGHFKRAGVVPVRLIREFRTSDLDGLETGQMVDLSIFEVGETIRNDTDPAADLNPMAHDTTADPDPSGPRPPRPTSSRAEKRRGRWVRCA